MRLNIFLISCIMLVAIIMSCSSRKQPLPSLRPELRAELVAWIEEHGTTPEQYIVSKFKDHDIVFLGEYHRIRHDVLLVQNVIPLLHQNGVYNLGLEFLRFCDQKTIDSLVTAETYDETLARKLFWNAWPFWGFKEYVDILKVTWQLNRSLPPDARPFRIVGLGGREDWSYVWSEKDLSNKAIMKKVFPDGNADQMMAETIEREILARKDKALIYSGINHAYTQFRQPVIDLKTGKLKRLTNTRMGNRIYEKIGDRCCTIFLHAPWPPITGYGDPYVYPADGVIDALFANLPPEKQRVGFDIKGSPFGKLHAETSLWSITAPDFRLEMFCDGWIHQMPLSRYEGVTVIPDWFNETNRLEAISQMANPNPRVKRRDQTVKELMEGMAWDCDFKRRFRRFY